MKSEQECNPHEKYLITDAKFSKELISIWQKECVSRVDISDRGLSYNNFINWENTSNEVALFTYYSYADFYIPKKFDCIFDLNDPSKFIKTNFILTQSIYEGWLPSSTIQHGHKHLCVFKFDEGIPDIINQLHVSRNKFSDVPKGSLKLGICQFTDFDKICDRIKN